MLQAVVTSSKPVRFRFFQFWKKRRTGIAVSIPERWSDLPERRRHSWWRLVCSLPEHQVGPQLLRSVLRQLPAWARLLLPAEDGAAIQHVLRWAKLKADCSDIALQEIHLRRTRYVLAKPMGRNVVAGEFAVCDDLYKSIVTKNDLDALRTLTAILYREEDPDLLTAQARGDARVPYHNKDEAAARLRRMGEPPVEMQMQALYYFAGLKQVIHRLYGRHIFQGEGSDGPAPTGPDFGWWGVLQGVAESGVFGDLRSTYQSFIHEVCVFLVRKKQESDAIKAAHENARNTAKNNDV